MKKDIQLLIEKIKQTYKRKKVWTYIVGILSCIAIFATIYSLIMPATAYTRVEEPNGFGLYKITLKDSFQGIIQDGDGKTTKDYTWKEKYYTNTSPNYELDLYYEDTTGNLIKGKNITIEVGPNKLEDKIYGFGGEPISDDGKETSRGKDLIDEFDLKELVTTTGEKYEFVEAKIKIDNTDTWYTLEKNNYWHIWCQYSDQIIEKGEYGWRGDYINASSTESRYIITEENKTNVKYKFIYKKVRYGNHTTDATKTVESLSKKRGITFKMFNYKGDLSGTGDDNINNNGTYNYFAFRDSSIATTDVPIKKNPDTDADGFGPNRTKVLSNLDAGKNPILDCKTKGGCENNLSLGYLFGANENAKGVTAYNPDNTLLQTRTENGVTYYYYDSSLNAVDFDIENEHFMVRNYTERGQSITSYPNEAATRYEFMPFDYLNDDSTLYTATNGVTYNHKTADIDHWYGMTMEFSFYMPKDGKINNQDMIFSFSGDDDVWVFIDGKLVLDLGGTHGAVDGTINFATGEVEGYLNWDGKNHKLITEENLKNNEDPSAYYNATTIYDAFVKAYTESNTLSSQTWDKWQDIQITKEEETINTKTFGDFTEHTLKFFYLERGAAVSNCKINFNIPVLPSGSLSVMKDFEGSDVYNEDHTFKLYKKLDDGTSVKAADEVYTLKTIVDGNQVEIPNQKTTGEGTFTLKDGEEAVFSSLSNYHNYYVEETTPGSHSTWSSCILDGETCKVDNEPSNQQTGVFEMEPDSTHKVVFTNKIKTFNLNVSKIAYDETEKEFDFKLNLSHELLSSPIIIPSDSNSKYTVNSETGEITFKLKNGEDIDIIGIPIDTKVNLQEINHDGYKTVIKSGDETLADGDTYEFTITDSKEVTVHNIPGVELPETGGSGIQNYLILGLFLIIVSLSCGYKYYFGLKEGGR